MIVADRRNQGFTLLEVLIALLVVAIAVAALARVGSQALNTQFEAEQRTLALWVADNQIAELRLEPPAPSERRQGSSRMAAATGTGMCWSSRHRGKRCCESMSPCSRIPNAPRR